MRHKKKKILGSVLYLLFTFLCGSFWLVLNVEVEIVFCIWYLVTMWIWLMFWIKIINMMGKRKKLKVTK